VFRKLQKEMFFYYDQTLIMPLKMG